MQNVMIDIETLSTQTNAAILSIGAVRFDHANLGQRFYRAVAIQSNVDKGRHISGDTLAWWMAQSGEARNVFADPDAVHLSAALHALGEFLGPDSIVWGNGANFDISILQSAYEQVNFPPPWRYGNVRCLRTVRNLAGADAVDKPTQGVAHNALDDAIWQAIWLIRARAQGVGK